MSVLAQARRTFADDALDGWAFLLLPLAIGLVSLQLALMLPATGRIPAHELMEPLLRGAMAFVPLAALGVMLTGSRHRSSTPSLRAFVGRVLGRAALLALLLAGGALLVGTVAALYFTEEGGSALPRLVGTLLFTIPYVGVWVALIEVVTLFAQDPRGRVLGGVALVVLVAHAASTFGALVLQSLWTTDGPSAGLFALVLLDPQTTTIAFQRTAMPGDGFSTVDAYGFAFPTLHKAAVYGAALLAWLALPLGVAALRIRSRREPAAPAENEDDQEVLA